MQVPRLPFDPDSSDPADALAEHFLFVALGREGLPSRRGARRALLQIIVIHGPPANPHPEDGRSLTALILAGFRPDHITCLRSALDSYAMNFRRWRKEIIKPYESWSRCRAS